MSTCDARTQHVVYVVRVIKKTRPYPKFPRISIPDLWYEVHAIVFEEHIVPHRMSEDGTLILEKCLPIYTPFYVEDHLVQFDVDAYFWNF